MMVVDVLAVGAAHTGNTLSTTSGLTGDQMKVSEAFINVTGDSEPLEGVQAPN